MRLTKQQIEHMKSWEALIKRNPKLAVAHFSWVSEEFIKLRDEMLIRLSRIEALLEVQRKSRKREGKARG